MKKNFLDKVLEIEYKYNIEIKNEFNIFSVLHNSYDERRLHSRFISNLLSPNSNHKQGNLFLKKFILLIKELKNFDLEFDFNNVTVTPNEFHKSEWQNIDIYIRNNNQAIIIENKIFAKDSLHINEDGKVVSQLLTYFQKVKRDLKLDDNTSLSNIHLIYLTLNGKEPSYIERFREIGITPILIDYIQFIPNWLDTCEKDLENPYLKDSILQYKRLLFTIINNFKLVMELKDLVSENIENAWDLLYNREFGILKSQFIHIKWHTVHEFWNELGLKIQENLNVSINIPPNELITKTTHRNFKKGLGLNFIYGENHYYIFNDKKGFTWGYVNNPKDFSRFNFINSENIIFSDFEKKETFRIINTNQRNEIINKIVSEMKNIIENKKKIILITPN